MSNRDWNAKPNQAGSRTSSDYGRHHIGRDDEWMMPVWVWWVVGIMFAAAAIYGVPSIGA